MNLKFSDMKAILSLMMALCFSIAAMGQDPDTISSGKKSDTTNFTLGKKEIRIVEKNGETDIKVKNRDNDHEEENQDSEENDDYSENQSENNDHWEWNDRKSDKHFKGHWDAFQIGINSYLAADKTTNLPASSEYMALNTSKSININLNMFQQSFGLIGKSLGIVTGLGLEFTNYVFDNNYTIIKNASGSIIPDDPGFKLDKSKLTTTFLTVPLLLEFQFPGDKKSNRLFINGGVIGGVKLGSHTKIKYKENGDKQDKKNRNDFNLNSLRYGFTGRIGIKHLSIFGTYYPVALFEKGKGEELYPFMVGLSFDGF